MKVSNELPGFAKLCCAIFLANQMLVGLAHYDSRHSNILNFAVLWFTFELV